MNYIHVYKFYTFSIHKFWNWREPSSRYIRTEYFFSVSFLCLTIFFIESKPTHPGSRQLQCPRGEIIVKKLTYSLTSDWYHREMLTDRHKPRTNTVELHKGIYSLSRCGLNYFLTTASNGCSSTAVRDKYRDVIALYRGRLYAIKDLLLYAYAYYYI